ncbi:hypothetical protein FRC00_008356 [Tulasnella sp. 408]|nr:hypothetical protein FRC00_008356 [Tulasnella sp. 408]
MKLGHYRERIFLPSFTGSPPLLLMNALNATISQKFPGEIFGAKTTGRIMYYVTDAALITQVYKQPTVRIRALRLDTGVETSYCNSSVLLLELRHVPRPNGVGTPVLLTEIFPHVNRSMAPMNIIGLVESFEQHFFLRLAHRATGGAYFGPTFDVERFWDDWKGFDAGIYKVALAYPVPMCPHFVGCRERVIQRFLEYLDDPAHEPCDRIAEMKRMARDAKLDRRDVGVMIMACYWRLMANVPWGSFWLLSLQLKRSEGLSPILAQLDAAGEAWASTQPDPTISYLSNLTAFFQSQPQLPLFQSTINEVSRFTSDSYSMRGVVPDEGAILGGYKFKKNDTLIMSTGSVHFDESSFDEDAKEVNPSGWLGSLSEEAKGSFRPYGGGVQVSMCGRHFASYHVKIFLTTLLHTFRFEVDKVKSPGPAPVTISSETRGFGLSRPQGELFVKVTRI